MTLELILWLVAWVVVSEVLFVISYYLRVLEDAWGWHKFFSFFLGGIFMMLQYMIIFASREGPWETPHYINLVYELIVLLVIGALFWCNWAISKKIDKSTKGKKK